MKTEFECRFINIDLDEMRDKLEAAGFACVQPEALQRRVTFDIVGEEGKCARWLRLRDEGNRVTLTLKEKERTRQIDSLRELETTVGDFETMQQILVAAGLVSSALQETRREIWRKQGIEACLDTWPGLRPYIEIEAVDEAAVRACAAELDLDWADAMFGNVSEVYMHELGLTLAEYVNCCTFANPPRKKTE